MATPLEEALTAVGAAALVQKRIDPNLLEYQRRYAPLVRSVPTVSWNSTNYYFNQRTQNPVGGFVTDGGAIPVSTSVYVQNLYPIKLLQTVGAVTGYAQQVTADLIGNLRAKEIMGAAKRLYWSVENGITWGNAASTLYGPAPQFDGLDTIASIFSGASQNAVNFNQGAFDLGSLDQLIDLVEQNVAEPVETSDWMFVLSYTANSKLSQIFTNQQRFVDQVEVETGLIVPSYRNIPLVKTSFLSPRGATNQMSAVTATGTSSGGALANGTYYYYVSAILDVAGEGLAQAVEASASVTGNGVITLAFTPPTGLEGAAPLTYKVYRSTASAGETLLGYVDAYVNTNPTGGGTTYQINQIIDNGATLYGQQSVGTIQNSSYPAAYTGTNTALQPLATGAQNVYLIARNSDYIIRPYVREFAPVDIYPTTASPDSLPFATVTDTTFAVRAPKYMGRLANVQVVLSN
jgi:hypothetical protein